MRNKAGAISPGIIPERMEWGLIRDKVFASADVREKIEKLRATKDKKEYEAIKKSLPSVCFVGRTPDRRLMEKMVPTQLVMIDIDHADIPGHDLWEKMKEKMGQEWMADNLLVAHITCSGKGLRIIFKAQEGLKTLEENMEWFENKFPVEDGWGKYDKVIKDFSRISFVSIAEDIVFENAMLYTQVEPVFEEYLQNSAESGVLSAESKEAPLAKTDEFTDEEKETFESFDYRGTPVKVIVEKYVELKGKPSAGEIHNYYNEMIKYFRCICDNNKRLLLYLLPRFGHSQDECWSQIVSICRTNTLSSIPKPFYLFLKDNGYLQLKEFGNGALKEYMLSDGDDDDYVPPPYVPPIIREFVNTAPRDFVVPLINALMPIMGTLTSYAYARYPYDDRIHTTSFFSVIYAPPSSGKGFVDNFYDLLTKDLKKRDAVQSARENIYLRAILRKGANEKAPELPHTSTRIVPTKTSEPEFLQKQQDNKGYHMLTYAAEMDTWAKGVKAAGGNKDDMLRIAWDNGEYGQQFKSANTFRGTVRMYWNALITGTLDQILNYFRNVENGLVTRCSFCSIENQEFRPTPKWKRLSDKSLKLIDDFIKRCDENSYEEPCNVDIEEMNTISDDEFDNQVNWRFKFKKHKEVNADWIMPVIDKFEEEQMNRAGLDLDHARDTFRRRVGVRGFRLAILCMCLTKNPNKAYFENCKKFIKWWMEVDIENMMKLWGQKYNEQLTSPLNISQRSVFNNIPENFTQNDVYAVCVRYGIKTPVRCVISNWKKLGFVEKNSDKTYSKINHHGAKKREKS